MSRHGRLCDCDGCYEASKRVSLIRQGWRACLSCGVMLRPHYEHDDCNFCRIESGEARWCDCGNEVIAVDGECSQAVRS